MLLTTHIYSSDHPDHVVVHYMSRTHIYRHVRYIPFLTSYHHLLPFLLSLVVDYFSRLSVSQYTLFLVLPVLSLSVVSPYHRARLHFFFLRPNFMPQFPPYRLWDVGQRVDHRPLPVASMPPSSPPVHACASYHAVARSSLLPQTR